MIDHIRNNGVQVVMQSFYASTPDSNGIFVRDFSCAYYFPMY
jgi:hypothetical protein